MNSAICNSLRRSLQEQADEKIQESTRRFFKEPVKSWGVKSSAVRKITRQYLREIRHLSKTEVFALCEELLGSDYQEEAAVAFEWVYARRKSYEHADFETFEKWVERYVNDWAKCDNLCNHAIGAFIEKYPVYLKRLEGWARRDHRWLRRAAAVSLVLPARKGLFLTEIFQIADILLLDPDDLVQKGYGWMLKEASRLHQPEVLDYVLRHKVVMPRTALRYAIEKMPPDLRRRAMEK
jgi:3-methyladenine DNA glycosylase AlkD